MSCFAVLNVLFGEAEGFSCSLKVIYRGLKVLSSEMDLAEIRVILIGRHERDRRGSFLEKPAHPPSSESPLKY
jgi:hypothetical protein